MPLFSEAISRMARRLGMAALYVIALVAQPAHAAQGVPASQALPAPLQLPDTIAQRVQACTQCHGKEGRSTNQGYFPRIAGKPAGYLYNQLLSFREGRRRNETMTYLVEHLSDAYLQEIAAYFSSLDLPYPDPLPAPGPADAMRGDALVHRGDPARGIPACTACHAAALTGVMPSTPGLLGLPPDYIAAQFGAWRAGQRKAAAPDCMAAITAKLNADDVGALATWLASRPVPVHAVPAASVPLPLPIACGSAGR